MPYKRVEKCVYKKKHDGSTGEKKGCSKTVAMAKRYLKKLYSVEEIVRESDTGCIAFSRCSPEKQTRL